MTDNNENKVLNVPHLRFPEFSGEWKMATFGDIAKGFDYGMNAAAKSFDGNNKYIRITDIDEVSSQYLYDDVVSPDGELEDRYLVKENDILLARTGASTGKSYLYRNSDGKLYFAGFLIRANIYKHNSYFVFSQLHTLRYKKWISVMSARSGQPGINSQEYASFPVYTTSLQEEDKIATFLKLLDERIITQNKIIEKLQSLIKGLSQQLLSSENDWILYRLDDLAQIKSGYSGTQVSYQTPYKVSRIETISKHCIDIQRIGYVECIPESYRLNVGNILFSNINSIQYIGNTAYLDKDYGLYHGMNLLRIIPNTTIVRPRFLHLLLCTDWAINHFQTICNKAVSQASINQTALGKSRFPIPPMSVQQQICSMFELTERKLDNEQEYISCLQQQKRYLLQKMFI